jgi:hypothetical protein
MRLWGDGARTRPCARLAIPAPSAMTLARTRSLNCRPALCRMLSGPGHGSGDKKLTVTAYPEAALLGNPKAKSEAA